MGPPAAAWNGDEPGQTPSWSAALRPATALQRDVGVVPKVQALTSGVIRHMEGCLQPEAVSMSLRGRACSVKVAASASDARV